MLGRLTIFSVIGLLIGAAAWTFAAAGHAQAEPTMVISPSSGPCDATVQITGRDFPPSAAIRLDVGHPGGDGKLGKLASLATDSTGRFALSAHLGDLGCDAARLMEELGTGSQRLWIFADLEERVIEPGEGIPPILTRTPYTLTTGAPAGPRSPEALAETGGGPDPSPMWQAGVPLAGLLVALAWGSLLVVVGALAWRRQFLSEGRGR